MGMNTNRKLKADTKMERWREIQTYKSVSYTHLTLPTILLV